MSDIQKKIENSDERELTKKWNKISLRRNFIKKYNLLLSLSSSLILGLALFGLDLNNTIYLILILIVFTIIFITNLIIIMVFNQKLMFLEFSMLHKMESERLEEEKAAKLNEHDTSYLESLTFNDLKLLLKSEKIPYSSNSTKEELINIIKTKLHEKNTR